MATYDLIASTTFGLEAIVGRELKALGYEDIQVENARVLFRGDESDICRANIWLRCAERVHIRFGEFQATDFDELFDQTRDLPWEEILPENANFPVDGKSIQSKLSSVPDCQAMVKKAIVERLKDHYHKNWFPEDGPRYKIEVALLRDVATITIDTSGAGLHKRGYRQKAGAAPLKETLAAALVQLSYWNRERILVDPFCGSGTILVEAAMQGLNIAPGLNREFDYQQWPQVQESVHQQAIENARAQQRDSLEFVLQGHDNDDRVLRTARENAKLAGVDAWVDFHKRDFFEFSTNRKYGCLITNPPYGERLGEQREAEEIYSRMKDIIGPLDTWSIYVLTACDTFETLYGQKAGRRRKLYNGRIKTTYFQYPGPRPPRPDDRQDPTRE